MASGAADKKLIGRVEELSFPELGFEGVHARIDTGAKTSSLWVSSTQEKNGGLEIVIFGPASEYYTGATIFFDSFEKTVVANSTGHAQTRYKVRILVKLRGKKIRAWFTLADRSTQVYPVLIGRNVLLGKFIVDVKKGRALKDEEQEHSQSLRAKIDKGNM